MERVLFPRTRKPLAMLLTLILAFTFTACGSSEQTTATTESQQPVIEVETTQQPETPEPTEEPEVKVEAVKEPTEPSATRGEIIEALFEYAGEPVVDIAPFMEYEDFPRYKFTDIEEGTPLALWYGYAIHAAGADENADGTYTYDADAPVTRMFLASVLIEDMANRAFPFTDVCQSSEPVTDVEYGTDFYHRNIAYLMQCGVITPASNAANVNPEAVSDTDLCPDAEVTKDEAMASIAAYKSTLEEVGVSGVIATQYNVTRDGKFASALNLTDEKPTQVAQQPTETAPSTTEKPADQPANTETSTPPTAATGVETNAPGISGYGFSPNVTLNTPYPITTICKNDSSRTASGTVTFTGYSRRSLGNGYDEITVTIFETYPDQNAVAYGIRTLFSVTDYYLYEEGTINEDFLDGRHGTFSLTYNGKVYDKCSVSDGGAQELDGSGTAVNDNIYITVKVPSGYDGIVVWVAQHPGTAIGTLSKLSNVMIFRCN